MSPHRTPGETLPDGPAPLPKGPAKSCPACGLEAIEKIESGYLRNGKDARVTIGRTDNSPVPMPRACSPERRLPGGLFRSCKAPGRHLHESCKGCGAEWLTAFAEGA